MLEKIADVPDGIDAFRVVGKVARADFEKTVEPLLDECRGQGRRLRLLLQLGPEYEGFTADAMWGKTETWWHLSVDQRVHGRPTAPSSSRPAQHDRPLWPSDSST